MYGGKTHFLVHDLPYHEELLKNEMEMADLYSEFPCSGLDAVLGDPQGGTEYMHVRGEGACEYWGPEETTVARGLST